MRIRRRRGRGGGGGEGERQKQREIEGKTKRCYILCFFMFLFARPGPFLRVAAFWVSKVGEVDLARGKHGLLRPLFTSFYQVHLTFL